MFQLMLEKEIIFVKKEKQGKERKKIKPRLAINKRKHDSTSGKSIEKILKKLEIIERKQDSESVKHIFKNNNIYEKCDSGSIIRNNCQC